MTRSPSLRGLLCLVAGATLAFSASGQPSLAKSKSAPKPAAKVAKFKPVTFMCQHGCKKNITVKSAADWKKVCPVCACKTPTSACKPKKA